MIKEKWSPSFVEFFFKIIFVTGGSTLAFTQKINPYGLENVLNKMFYKVLVDVIEKVTVVAGIVFPESFGFKISAMDFSSLTISSTILALISAGYCFLVPILTLRNPIFRV